MKQINGIVDATATAYFLSYKCLINKHLEVCDFYSDSFSVYFVPAITTAAFSCELALKNICQHRIGKKLRGHDLYKLLSNLDESSQRDIMNRTINAYNMKSEMLNSTDQIDEDSFINLLISHKDSFTLWRYFYEGLPDIDLDFFEAFLFCLNNVDDEYKEYVSSELIRIKLKESRCRLTTGSSRIPPWIERIGSFIEAH